METFDSYVLFILIALPMIGALALMVIPGYQERAIRWTASAFALPSMLLSFYIFAAYYFNPGGMQFT